jgi:outer membrane protein TolC
MNERAWYRRLSRAVGIPLLFVASFSAPATAADKSATPGVVEPPIFQYGEGRITLLESVRLALEHDPKLLLSRTDVRLRQGVEQELRGAFDWLLSGSLEYNHQKSELRDSTKKAELDKRRKARLQETQVCGERDRQQQLVTELQAAQGDTSSRDQIPSDFSLDQQLDLLDSLIETAGSNPTLQQDLTNQRNSFIAKEILVRQRDVIPNLVIACDDAHQSVIRLGEAPDFEVADQGKFDLRLQKLFRSGITLTPFINSTYDHQQFDGKKNGPDEDVFVVSQDPATGAVTRRLLCEVVEGKQPGQPCDIPITRTIEFGGKQIDDVYSASVGFELNLPLLRGRGAANTGSGERAARADYEAAAANARHAASESAVRAATAYWTLYGAQQRVAVLEHSVELQTRIADLTKALVDGDELPKTELVRSQAGAANSRAQLESARQQLSQARIELAKSIGIAVESEANAPLADGPFPSVPAPDSVNALGDVGVVRAATDARIDVAAAKKSVEARRIATEGARLDSRAKLDMGVSLFSKALGEKSYSNAVDRWADPSGKFSLKYEHPLGNNERLGRWMQQQAQLAQQEIKTGDLERNVGLNVVLALRSLADAASRYAQADAAAKLFDETVAAELEKLRLGDSTLIDTILTEQQTTQAKLALIAAQQDVAILLARLRFETGTILAPLGEAFEIKDELMTTLPGGQS